MSFKPQGVATAFGATNRKPGYANDRLCVVKGYNLGPTAESSSMTVEETDRDGITKKTLVVTIDPKTSARIRGQAQDPQREPAKWVGSAIDERMKTHVPVGSWVVLDRALVTRTQKIDGISQSVVVANYINKVPTASPEKAFRGVFTISSRDGRVNAVQCWDPKAIDSNDQAAINALSNELDEVSAHHAQTQIARKANPDAQVKTAVLPGRGVRFRAIVRDGETTPRGDAAPQPKFMSIDRTQPFEWISATRDGEGNIIEEGRPLNGEKFVALLKDYAEYLDATYPETDPRYADLRIEITPCRVYRASKMSRQLNIPTHEGLPLYRMVNTPTKCSPGDADYVREKNWAVSGILVLSSDTANAATREFIDRDFVQSLYANGYMADLDNLVTTAKDEKVVVSPELDRPKKVADNAASAGSAPTSGSVSAPADAGLVASSQDPFDMSGVSDPFAPESASDPYAQAFTAATPAAAPAASPAEAPAQAPASGRRRSSLT